MNPLKEILNLSIPERILMVEAIWDSIARDTHNDIPPHPGTGNFNAACRYEKEESTIYTWEEMMSKLKSEK